jgi:hypothetical protein
MYDEIGFVFLPPIFGGLIAGEFLAGKGVQHLHGAHSHGAFRVLQQTDGQLHRLPSGLRIVDPQGSRKVGLPEPGFSWIFNVIVCGGENKE